MSVLKSYFDKSVNQTSRVVPDYDRKVNYDGDGNEVITYVEVDYPTFQESNGLVGDWSLDALLKAGINPNFPIHTGNPTRLEGVDYVNAAVAQLDGILAGEPADEPKE